MIRRARPLEPAERARSPELAKARRALRTALTAGRDPALQDRWWQDYKGDFARAHGDGGRASCGYCGVRLFAGQAGQMDHFAPKSTVARNILDPGVEDDDLPTFRRSRKLDGPPAGEAPWQGYAWRAYDWDNYVLCCERCNVGWKRTLFPARASGALVQGEAVEGRDEEPLLLSPYDNHPEVHLEFRADGTVRPLSDQGRWTIDILGLNARAGLVQERIDKAEDARSWLAAAEPNFEMLVKRGAPDQEHAAVVRGVAEQMTGCTWEEIVRAFGADHGPA